MKNLDKKSLFESTVFQYGVIIDLFAAGLYASSGITGAELLGTITAGFVAYVAKEGIAKGSEAYRDQGGLDGD